MRLRPLVCIAHIVLLTIGCAHHENVVEHSRACAPVTSDRRWNEIQWDESPGPHEMRSGHSNAAPALPAAFEPSSLRGQFELLMVATAGVRVPDTLRQLRLSLEHPDSTHRFLACIGRARCTDTAVTVPLIGAIDSVTHLFGSASIATSVESGQ